MNSTTPRLRALRQLLSPMLLGSASFVALIATGAAQAQAPAASLPPPPQIQAQAAPGVPEQVLVTGSLIAGAAAVGVPVSSFGPVDFGETGALSLSSILQSVPALNIDAEPSPAYGGSALAFRQNVEIHSIGTSAGVETLLLVDGLRFPPQNQSNNAVDPSIIAPIALQRVDVLTAGSSAVYGSDATAGVINLILRRGYDGAMTQLSVSASPGAGSLHTQAAQLYGHSWDTGNITVSYTRTDGRATRTEDRSYYTADFTPWGLQDSTQRGSSIPGTVHVGNAITVNWPDPGKPTPVGFSNAMGTQYCGSSSAAWPLCYSIPKGQNGTNLTWAAIVSNTGGDPTLKNLVNNWAYGNAKPSLQWNQYHATLDQRITPDLLGFLGPVSFFVTSFYSDQKSKETAVGGPGNQVRQTNLVVPTTNPYYPIGGPPNLRVDYSFAIEMPTFTTGGERAGRVAGGFNLDGLPFDWIGKIQYSWTDDNNYTHSRNTINPNNLKAALGNIIPASGGSQSYTKPAGVPYLNVFCDTSAFTCNDPATLQYLAGFSLQDEHFKISEYTANFSGPIFQLPGGQLKGALAFQHLAYDWTYQRQQNDNTQSTSVVTDGFDFATQNSNAVFGQLDIPVVGPEMNIPLVENFLVELGYRYDSYDNQDKPVFVRKAAANWTVGYGVTLHGAWGESFRVPSFGETGNNRSSVAGLNPLGLQGRVSDIVLLNCANVGITGATPGVALPGSLTALLNPTCSTNPALSQPGAIDVGNAGGGPARILRGSDLKPQTMNQWSLGLNLAPATGWFSGLTADVTWFRLEFRDLLGTADLGPTNPDNPAFRSFYTVIPRPDLPITAPENAGFLALVNEIAFYPVVTGGTRFDPAAIPNVKFIENNAISNLGSRVFSGIDFVVRYDFDLARIGLNNMGSLNVGATGYYQVIDKTRLVEGADLSDAYAGQDSGNRLQRVRYRLGWANDSWNATLFANYTGHGYSTAVPGNNFFGEAQIPPCFYQTGFGPGSCFPGSPFFGPSAVYPNWVPAQVLFDMSVGYQTGMTPANEYLRNIGIQFTIINLFDRPPPFEVAVRATGTLHAFNESFSDLQRTFTLSLTKVW